MIGIAKGTFFKNLFRIVPICAILICTMIVIKNVIVPNGWIMFIISCVLAGGIGYLEAAIYFYRDKIVQILHSKGLKK